MMALFWAALRSGGVSLVAMVLPYVGFTKRYLPLILLVLGTSLGALGGWYFTSSWYKLDEQARMGAAIAAKNSELDRLVLRTENQAKTNATLERRAHDATQKYKALLNRDPVCNPKLGVVRMLNIQLDPLYRPEDLSADRAASTAALAGGDIAEALSFCATEYNKVRSEIIELRKTLK